MGVLFWETISPIPATNFADKLKGKTDKYYQEQDSEARLTARRF
jgi:hypothetical protein